jgi:hypothetical protein
VTIEETIEEWNEFETVFTKSSRQHGLFARKLQAEVERSISGTLLRGWMKLKSAVSSGNSTCETGEESAIAAFAWVVSLDISGQTRILVEKQCETITEAHWRLLGWERAVSNIDGFRRHSPSRHRALGPWAPE